MHWRVSQQLQEHQHLLILSLAGEQGDARIQLNQDASERPHVNGSGVTYPQYYLRSSIETALNVGINLPSVEATASHIDHLYPRLVLFLQQDVLGLQVTVDDSLPTEKVQRLQDLDGKAADEVQGKTGKVGFLNELIKVLREDLKLQTSVPPEYERTLEPYYVVSELRIV